MAAVELIVVADAGHQRHPGALPGGGNRGIAALAAGAEVEVGAVTGLTGHRDAVGAEGHAHRVAADDRDDGSGGRHQ